MDHGATLGERVAFYRRRRGLSQVEFAALVGRSESWLSQVERGVRSIDRMSVLTLVANALNVPVSELAGGAPAVSQEAEQHYVDELRLALSGHPAPETVLGSAADEGPGTATVDALREQVESLWPLAHRSQYEELARSLVALVPRLEQAARGLGGRRRSAVYRLLAVTYQAAAAMLARLDEVDAAWVASERAVAAAELAGDRLGVVAGQYRMAQAFVSTGRLDQARHVAGVAAGALDHGGHLGPEADSLAGAFELVLAVVAARDGNRADARVHLERAQSIAQRLGADRNDFDTEFGPTNVAVHQVSIAVELGDAGEALDRAAGVDVSVLSAERQARFLIDVARAHAQRRRMAEAVKALADAEALAPEQVRDHHVVRETVRDLLAGAGRRPYPELQELAGKLGVLP